MDKNAKQPWPDQTGCCVSVCVCVLCFFFPCCYLASATVLSSEEKGERSNHGDVSLAAARWLVVKGLEGVERLLQTLLCKQNEPD